MNNIKQIDKSNIVGTYARFDLQIVKGKGDLCWDENGKEYIDLTTGIGVNSFGFCDDTWKEAVIAQASTLQHTSNLYYTEPCAKLAKMLIEKTGMQKVFFANSGAEANECGIKVARKWGAKNKGADFYQIITLENSLHGRTITTLSATGQEVYHKDFTPQTDGFLHVPAEDVSALEECVKQNDVCAIMFEVVMGEGGVVSLSENYIRAIEKICKENNILMFIDEVQTGNGRCGTFYSYMAFDLQPDIVSTAKGLGGGLPIGACILSEKTADTLVFGDHGSTFGGNPVSSAGACTIVERLDEKFLAEVCEKSAFIRGELADMEGVLDVSGMGLMIGVKTKRDAGAIIAECMAEGVLMLKAKDRVRMLPPLNISNENIKKALAIFAVACEKE